ncbi:MAG: putative spermidine/putrescine transport system permease protein [Pseudonocardiales bacterium]|nr:putative spermidine/putrescine transport system permease protein [Pseudonocardiales bacterium]
MYLSSRVRWSLRILTCVGLAFLYVPLVLVVLNAFNRSRTFSFPPTGFTLKWWHAAANSSGALHALGTSVRAGLGATAIALVLGTMAAFAVQRYDFFGRSTISFLVILPIALPGIVTGIALNAAFSTALDPLGIGFGLTTVIIGHATFCIVVVYNNVQARLRRMSGSLEEASADLGATGWQTFRLVTFPALRGALVAGALLAFGLSFDEIVVTTFTSSPDVQTLPLWIFSNLFRPNQAPVVNVDAAVLIVLAVVPVWFAQRLGDDAASSRL